MWQGYIRFRIKYFMIDVCQYYECALDSEYARVLNKLGLHMVVNKIAHDRHLTRFWCLEFWLCQCYIGLFRKPLLIHVWMFDRVLSIPRILNILEFEYTRVMNVRRLHKVLCKLYLKDSRYLECLEIWICQGFESVKSLNMS